MNSVKKLSSKDWTLQDINDFLNTNSKIVLDKSTESIVKKQREKLEKLLKNKSAPIYGINTGFRFPL
jgi:histidine ammonia-lyase